MRWVLNRSPFLRFYLLLGLTLLGIFLIALTGRMLIEIVRHDDYQEQLAHFPMEVLVAELAPLTPDERQQRLLTLHQQFGGAVSLNLVPLNKADFGYFEKRRLAGGSRVIETSPWRLCQPLNESSRLLCVEFDEWHEQHWIASVALAAAELAEIPAVQQPARLKVLSNEYWPLRLHDQLPDGLSSYQRQTLASGQTITRLDGEQLRVTFFTALPNTSAGPPRWLEVGLAADDDFLPLHLHLPLLLGVMIVLSLAIYLIMRNIEARMARLEQAAARIASGRLETRVKVKNGDFLGRLGMAFNGMANQVQSLLRGQQEMIRAVSHELRTPVARIRFAVQMVEDMTDQPAIRRQLQGIDDDISELDQLVDEILTYARLGGEAVNGAEMETSLVDCRSMVERVLDTLAPLHESMTLTLLPGPEIELLAEPRYLQRALQNLVSNACRHGCSQVEVRLWDEPHLVRIDVEDDGPGVPEDSRGEVFKPFTRLDDSRTRSSGGYGLGLSIVQKIMAGHGGSVMVDASPSLGGARFTLLIPRRESPV